MMTAIQTNNQPETNELPIPEFSAFSSVLFGILVTEGWKTFSTMKHHFLCLSHILLIKILSITIKNRWGKKPTIKYLY